MKPGQHILSTFRRPWLIDSETLRDIRNIAARAHTPDMEAVLAKRGQRLENTGLVEMRGSVAILPIHGPIFRYANLFTEISGATSIEILATDLRRAVRDSKVSTIILDIDSPGGQVNGVSDIAQMVRAASTRKPVIAHVSGMAASAGYWIASAAPQIVVSDTAQVGSIGVVSTVYIDDDDSIVEIVSSQSPGKRPDVRTDEGRAQIQRDTDAIAQIFVETVAANRGVTADKVLTDFGKGGLLVGRDAVAAGMADRVGVLEALIAGHRLLVAEEQAAERQRIGESLPPLIKLVQQHGLDGAQKIIVARATGRPS